MNLKNILSKSDFKVAQSCATKLYYLKNGYPSVNDGNEYMEYLAEGGYAVGEMATYYYPEGIRIDNSQGVESAIEQTRELIQQENVVLFEAAFVSGQKLAVVDILKKEGNHISIIEVKSKGYDGATNDLKDWKENIEDVSFQTSVVLELFSNFKVKAYLFAPDKSKTTSIEGLNALFELKQVTSKNGFKFFEIEFHGDKELIVKDDLLSLVDISDQVNKILPSIISSSKTFESSIYPEIKKIETPLSKDCFKCEYKDSGMKECWATIPNENPHIMDLYHIGTLGGYKEPIANQLIQDKKVSLYDIPLEQLSGKRGERQIMQIEQTRKNEEWIAPELISEIKSWQYPLHFIDFETCTTALPFHRGMRPYEMSAFQWSCHTIRYEGAEPEHFEWLNVNPSFPSFEFAESLMQHVGNNGTLLMWSSHENTTLRNIYYQLEEYNVNIPGLKKWLEYVVKFDSNGSGAFIDMNKLCLDYYFHPLMKGRTSIKVTLPAVLAATNSKRVKDWLENFGNNINLYSEDQQGNIVNPYKNLPPMELLDEAESVNEGTGAMRAYEDMLFGLAKNNSALKEEYRKALLNYCKLDTLAMVIIFEHWKSN